MSHVEKCDENLDEWIGDGDGGWDVSERSQQQFANPYTQFANSQQE